MRWRAYLRVAATEVDDRLSLGRGGLCDPPEQVGEVLPRKPLQPLGSRTHAAIVRRSLGSSSWSAPGSGAQVAAERQKLLALVLAGGEGGRLEPLTNERAKPALPFAGVYRLIDFPLTNCHHSGVSDVWVFQQYEPYSLSLHVSNGRPWDLDRTHGGLRVVHPYRGDAESGWYEGNADAIHRHREEIEEFDPDLILVLSADHIYKLDYSAVVARHDELGAGLTVVTTRVAPDEAARFGCVKVGRDDRIEEFEYKPDDPDSDVVTAEVFLYDAGLLLETLAELAKEGGDELKDFGHGLLPRLVDQNLAYAFPLDGYWKDVGTIDSYWGAHMELLSEEPSIDLDEARWPILTLAPHRPPAYVADGARIENSLLAPGSQVRGTVVRSVLAPGVVVEAGSDVIDSVILENAVIHAGASVSRAIVDARASVRSAVGGGTEIAVAAAPERPG
jgi:glucose-1-phosphate adenylyltransferase